MVQPYFKRRDGCQDRRASGGSGLPLGGAPLTGFLWRRTKSMTSPGSGPRPAAGRRRVHPLLAGGTGVPAGGFDLGGVGFQLRDGSAERLHRGFARRELGRQPAADHSFLVELLFQDLERLLEFGDACGGVTFQLRLNGRELRLVPLHPIFRVCLLPGQVRQLILQPSHFSFRHAGGRLSGGRGVEAGAAGCPVDPQAAEQHAQCRRPPNGKPGCRPPRGGLRAG